MTGGYDYHCKECRKITSIGSWSKVSPEAKHRKNEKKKFDVRSRATSLMSAYRKADKRKGLENTMTLEWAMKLLSSHCTYCAESEISKLGIDRLDNSVGHTDGNTISCCHDCNTARSDHFTYDEMIQIGQVIAKIKLQRRGILFG